MNVPDRPSDEQKEIEVLRSMTVEQRLRHALELSDQAREKERARIKKEHPDWIELEITHELIRLAFLPEPMPDRLIKTMKDRLAIERQKLSSQR
jgi:hypothetical protein